MRELKLHRSSRIVSRAKNGAVDAHGYDGTPTADEFRGIIANSGFKKANVRRSRSKSSMSHHSQGCGLGGEEEARKW